MRLPALRPLLLGGALVGSLLVGSVLARHGTTPELADLVAGSLPAAPAALVPVASVTRSSVPTPDPQWVGRTAAATGVPAGAVQAYGRGEIVAAREEPGCHLGWTTLAGIGWVESRHGTIAGGEDVVGPKLSSGERALGPMQFLPSTWSRWASDGDGDGAADVNDLDDAAVAAARYLCDGGRSLAEGAAWSAAVFSYNHSDAYVWDVYRAAEAYAGRS